MWISKREYKFLKDLAEKYIETTSKNNNCDINRFNPKRNKCGVDVRANTTAEFACKFDCEYRDTPICEDCFNFNKWREKKCGPGRDVYCP